MVLHQCHDQPYIPLYLLGSYYIGKHRADIECTRFARRRLNQLGQQIQFGFGRDAIVYILRWSRVIVVIVVIVVVCIYSSSNGRWFFGFGRNGFCSCFGCWSVVEIQSERSMGSIGCTGVCGIRIWKSVFFLNFSGFAKISICIYNIQGSWLMSQLYSGMIS